MKFKALAVAGIGLLLFSGCCDKCKTPPLIKQGGAKKANNCVIRLEARGVGVVPVKAASKSQAIAMARRAAMVDAYKALAEKLYGIKINGRDTVKNMILQNSTLRAYVEGVIRGAKVEDEEYKNGIYSVVMSLKVDTREWNRYLASNNYI